MQNKCVPYWPDSKGSKEVGQYVVTIKSEREATDYKVRVVEIFPAQQVTSQSHPLSPFSEFCPQDLNVGGFSLSLSQPKNCRTIWHYQYMSWPDHGVPEEPGGILSFLAQVNTKQAEFADAGPMVIHCRYEAHSHWNRAPTAPPGDIP